MSLPKIWFRSSSGFGRHITELALQSGDIAIATLRSPAALADLASQYGPDKLLILRLDVSKPDEIREAFAKAKEAFGRIDVVFNNAGSGLMSEVEGTPDDVARAMFEVNFWGAANVSQEAVRFFREINVPAGGRLLQVSSSGGVQGLPAIGYYCASKFAIEGLTEALADEIRFEWNIKVTLIELGGFMTNAGRSMVRSVPPPAYIERKIATARAYLTVNPRMPSDAIKGAAAIYKMALTPDPPLQFVLGKDSLEKVKKKGESLIAAAEASAPFSEGLELDPSVLSSRL
ncbi:hypothetical protein IEO21_05416 [Rhodonia placenta]|uniref:NAD(P)-binding protein n=1 Tax=Rhodonia placenta TaxID=104341 RepID=A0A8H7P1Z4_9APHY|nr:hypothetical protein IEO21_05416 [Postia placenta]